MQEAKKNIIEVDNLYREYKVAEKGKNYLQYFFNRKYKKISAVNDISFTINEGESVGFLGPNGAGKSTTIKMLVGILTPSSGKIKVFGREPSKYRKENAQYIGVVFGQKSQLWWDLPVIDTYLLLKKIYKISEEEFEYNLKYYVSELDMDSFLHQPVRQLSLGQRMRAELCAALLHNPKILFLDEPTIGLDIVVKKQIRLMINKINRERNVTILLTTHDLKDIEDVCDRIILINHGHIVIDENINYVKDNYKGVHSIIFRSMQCWDITFEMDGISDWKIEKDVLTVFYKPKVISAATVIKYVMEHHKIDDIEIKSPSIDDIIEQYYK